MAGKDRQGSIITNEHEVGAPYVNFGSALMNTFTQSKDAILILDGYMMALMHDINCFFYLFDPHARNSFGMSDPNGTAVVFEFLKSQFIPNYLKMRYSPICACAQRSLLFIIQTVYLGFISFYDLAKLNCCLDNLLYSRIMKM
jgi:hypothetical protein